MADRAAASLLRGAGRAGWRFRGRGGGLLRCHALRDLGAFGMVPSGNRPRGVARGCPGKRRLACECLLAGHERSLACGRCQRDGCSREPSAPCRKGCGREGEARGDPRPRAGAGHFCLVAAPPIALASRESGASQCASPMRSRLLRPFDERGERQIGESRAALAAGGARSANRGSDAGFERRGRVSADGLRRRASDRSGAWRPRPSVAPRASGRVFRHGAFDGPCRKAVSERRSAVRTSSRSAWRQAEGVTSSSARM